MEKIWTILELIRWSADYFAGRKISTPRLDAEVLLSHILGMERTRLYVEFERPLTQEELSSYKELIKRRAKFEPIAYILGEKEFWSMNFKVTPDVLIPRPDTEVLIETALSLTHSIDNPSIVDIGTGSGILAIVLAKEIKNAKIIATDISEKALSVAKENAKKHGVEDKIDFRLGFLFSCLEDVSNIDLLVSNPPYVSESELAQAQPDVREYEPHLALRAGSDGLELLRPIIANAGNWLKSNGNLCLEIGSKQAKTVSELMEARKFANIKITKDYAGLDRVISAHSATSGDEPPRYVNR